MVTEPKAPLLKSGLIPQPVIVIGVIALCCVAYGLASGIGVARDLDHDRMVIGECWKSVARQELSAQARKDRADSCARMERGMRLKYGSAV